jgi:hypothetical protein
MQEPIYRACSAIRMPKPEASSSSIVKKHEQHNNSYPTHCVCCCTEFLSTLKRCLEAKAVPVSTTFPSSCQQVSCFCLMAGVKEGKAHKALQSMSVSLPVNCRPHKPVQQKICHHNKPSHSAYCTLLQQKCISACASAMHHGQHTCGTQRQLWRPSFAATIPLALQCL